MCILHVVGSQCNTVCSGVSIIINIVRGYVLYVLRHIKHYVFTVYTEATVATF